MSLFGKILALLNLLGAAGLIFVASMDYGKHQVWAHVYARTEVILTGLPVDEKELDSSNTPAVDRLGEADYADMFKGVGGNPVNTQAQEINKVLSELTARIASVEANKPQHTALLGRILLPFTDSNLERDQLIAAAANFGTQQAYDDLLNRCRQARAQALDPNPPGKAFREAFRAAFHSKQGPPADLFLSLVLRKFTDDIKQAATVDFDAEFNQAVDDQLSELKKRYAALINEANGQAADESSKAPELGLRKAAIARLLFGIALFQAEELLGSDGGNPNDRARLAAAKSPALRSIELPATETFRQQINRMLVVCGLRASLGAISERISAVQRLYDYAQNAAAEERQQFVNDHNFRVSVVREMAGLVRGEKVQIAENEERLLGYETISKQRKEEIDQLTAEKADLRSKSAQKVKDLRDLSEQLLGLRVKIRDALENTEKSEERIRSLEKQIRDKERTKSK